MNDFYDYDGQWYPELDAGLSFPDISLTDEENPPEKPQPGKLSQLEFEPRSAWREAKVLISRKYANVTVDV